MRVGLCSIGSELVSGHVADTNSSWFAARAVESGCSVHAILTVGDERGAIRDALEWMTSRADVLLVGGGLGPTADDITRDAVADFAGVELRRRPELEQHLHQVYARLERQLPPDALRQADVPDGAQVHDPRGTAAGFTLEVPRGAQGPMTVHVLPGVPWEYRELAERVVLPDLVRRTHGSASVTRSLHVAGLGESGVGEVLRPLTDRLAAASTDPRAALHGIELGFLATDDEVLVRVTATGSDPKDARQRTDPVLEEASRLLGAAVTSVDERRLEDVVGGLLGQMGATLSTAETCTGGRVAALLAGSASGADRLHGSWVDRSPDRLLTLLGSSPSPDVTAGSDSATAALLASSVRRRSGAGWGLAVVGVVDETDATVDRPVGSMAWAVVDQHGGEWTEERFVPAGDRAVLQARGAAFAVESLRRVLLAVLSPREPTNVTP